tara:strand:+ start:28 stop:1137 length:1110 start_codon:yes stop_codon:yes gene_type:complete
MPDRDDKLIFEGYQRILEKMEKIEAADYIVNVLSSDVTNAEVIKKNILIALDGMNSAEKNDVLVALGDRDDGGVRKLPDEKYQHLINTYGRLFGRQSTSGSEMDTEWGGPPGLPPYGVGGSLDTSDQGRADEEARASEPSDINESLITEDDNLNRIQEHLLYKLKLPVEGSSYTDVDESRPALLPKFVSYKAQLNTVEGVAAATTLGIELLYAAVLWDGSKGSPVFDRKLKNNFPGLNPSQILISAQYTDPLTVPDESPSDAPFPTRPDAATMANRRLLYYTVAWDTLNHGGSTGNKKLVEKINADHKGQVMQDSINEVLNKLITTIVESLDYAMPEREAGWWHDEGDPLPPIEPFWGAGDPPEPGVLD